MTATEAIDARQHGRRVRRVLESNGYNVASVATVSGNIVAVLAAPPPAGRAAGEKHIPTYGDRPELEERLTAKETAALHALVARAGSVVPRGDLIATIWPGGDPTVCTNRLYNGSRRCGANSANSSRKPRSGARGAGTASCRPRRFSRRWLERRR